LPNAKYQERFARTQASLQRAIQRLPHVAFSETRRQQMGRLGFGRPSVFASVVRVAHQRGMTTSGDLLFNLPGQTSLTNIERAELADDPRRYRYEPISYESRCQVLGFGPAGISYTAAAGSPYALKTLNPESSAEYLQAVHAQGSTTSETWSCYISPGV
jgi:coproporphyrinogen III oxidase-like Fe-S oxidoreductase